MSTWGFFNAQLLYVSRLPWVMACDGWLPAVFAKVSPDSAVPRTAIISFCLLAALFSALSFGGLAVIQSVLYTGALTLEFLALIVVRVRRSAPPRSFRVPGGWWGLIYVCLAPLVFATLVLIAILRDWKSYLGQLLVVGLVLISGAALYFLRRKMAIPPDGPMPEGGSRFQSTEERSLQN